MKGSGCITIVELIVEQLCLYPPAHQFRVRRARGKHNKIPKNHLFEGGWNVNLEEDSSSA